MSRDTRPRQAKSTALKALQVPIDSDDSDTDLACPQPLLRRIEQRGQELLAQPQPSSSSIKSKGRGLLSQSQTSSSGGILSRLLAIAQPQPPSSICSPIGDIQVRMNTKL